MSSDFSHWPCLIHISQGDTCHASMWATVTDFIIPLSCWPPPQSDTRSTTVSWSPQITTPGHSVGPWNYRRKHGISWNITLIHTDITLFITFYNHCFGAWPLSCLANGVCLGSLPRAIPFFGNREYLSSCGIWYNIINIESNAEISMQCDYLRSMAWMILYWNLHYEQVDIFTILYYR